MTAYVLYDDATGIASAYEQEMPTATRGGLAVAEITDEQLETLRSRSSVWDPTTRAVVVDTARATAESNVASQRNRVDQAIAALEANCATRASWDALNAAARQEITRVGLLAVAKLARLILDRRDSA